MGIENFIIVLAYNMWWATDGIEHFKNIYNGHYNKLFSAFIWLFTLWGVVNLIYYIS